MIIRTAGILGAVFFGVLALACGTETTVLTESRDAAGVSVSGEASAFGEPDVAILTLGVDAEADTVADARAMAAEAMDGMIQVLKDGGVDESDIQTTRFSVQAEFDFLEGRQELRGFSVSNIVTAKIRTIDDSGTLIDDAVSAGGDLARIDGLSFTIDDPSQLEDEARRLAMADAKEKAETLAGEAGVGLGPPLSISEGGGQVPVNFAGAQVEFLADESARTPIQAGELEIVVRVQVLYELER